jgi:hypothetical protein
MMLQIPGGLSGAQLGLLSLSTLLTWLPGLVVGFAIGLRGWVLAGTAPATTYAVSVLASTAGTALGLRWSPWFLVIATAIVLILVVAGTLIRRFTASSGSPMAGSGVPGRWTVGGHVAVAAAACVAAAVAARVFLRGSGGLDAVGQGWDAVFHANAVRLIAESGNSSSVGLTAIGNPETDGLFFYPNAWHSLQALVFQLSESSIPEVMNASAVVCAALMLPLGVVALLRAAGTRATVAACAAFVSTAFAAFPFDLWTWGQLYPYAAAMCLALPFLALLLVWRRRADVLLTGLVAAVAVAIFLTHSSVVFVVAVPALLLLARELVGSADRWRLLGRLSVLTAVSGFLALPHLRGLQSSVSGVAGFDWPAVGNISTAFGDALLQGNAADVPQWSLGLLMTIGLLLLLRSTEHRWIAVSGGVFAFLYVVAAALQDTRLDVLTAPWYNDRYRIAAAIPLFGMLALGFLLAGVADRLRSLVPPSSERVGVAVRGVAVTATLAVFVLTVGFSMDRNSERLRPSFASPVVSDLERAGMSLLPALVGPDEVVMNDRLDGSNWIYALTGVRTVFLHYSLPVGKGERRQLLRGFDSARFSSSTRALIAELDITYVVTGEGFMAGGERAPGLRALDRVPWLDQVYANPEFAIYRIDRLQLDPTSG